MSLYRRRESEWKKNLEGCGSGGGVGGNAVLQLDAIRIRKRIDAFGLGNLVCSSPVQKQSLSLEKEKGRQLRFPGHGLPLRTPIDKYALYRGKPRRDGCATLFLRICCKINQPTPAPLPHKICTARKEVNCLHLDPHECFCSVLRGS